MSFTVRVTDERLLLFRMTPRKESEEPEDEPGARSTIRRAPDRFCMCGSRPLAHAGVRLNLYSENTISTSALVLFSAGAHSNGQRFAGELSSEALGASATGPRRKPDKARREISAYL